MDKIDNPFKYAADPELNIIFDKLVSLKARVANEFAKAEKIAGFNSNVSFLPLRECKISLPNYQYDYGRSTFTSEKSLSALTQQVLTAITNARAHVAEVEAENSTAVAKNKEIYSQVKEIMTRLGVTESYTSYDYPTSRSRVKRSSTHTAGYITDLNRVMPRSNVESTKHQINEYERNFNSWLVKVREELRNELIQKDEQAIQKLVFSRPKFVAAMLAAGVNIFSELANALPGAKTELLKFCQAKAYQNIYSMDKYVMAYHYIKKINRTTGRKELYDEFVQSFPFETPEEKDFEEKVRNEVNGWIFESHNLLRSIPGWSESELKSKITNQNALAALEDLESNE